MTAAAISTAHSASAAPEDAELLAAWNAHGRRGDFEELVRRHLGLVQGTARRQLGDDLAEDTVLTVFAVLHARLRGWPACAVSPRGSIA